MSPQNVPINAGGRVVTDLGGFVNLKDDLEVSAIVVLASPEQRLLSTVELPHTHPEPHIIRHRNDRDGEGGQNGKQRGRERVCGRRN